jgi:hypothetical protein
MRKPRLTTYCTIDQILINNISNIARIISPQQAHSWGHIQQCSQHLQITRACSGIMRNPRLTIHDTIDQMLTNNISKIARIIPPQPAHSLGHVQQCGQHSQITRACSGIMRQPRHTTYCTIYSMLINNISKTARIIPPQQAHSWGHVRQRSQYLRIARACSGTCALHELFLLRTLVLQVGTTLLLAAAAEHTPEAAGTLALWH